MESLADVINGLLATRSQSELARTILVDRSRVSEWKRGLAVPSPQVLERLSESFGLNLERLMRLCNYHVGRSLFDADPDELEAMAIYRQVPVDQRIAAKKMLLGLSVVTAAVNGSIVGVVNHSNPRINTRRRAQQPPLQSHNRPVGGAVRAFISALLAVLSLHGQPLTAATA